MLKLLTCPNNHFWEAEEGQPATEVCPRCGSPAESLPLLDLVASPPPSPRALPEPPPPLVDAAGQPVVEGYRISEDLGCGPHGVRRFRAMQKSARREVLLEIVLARDVSSSQQAWEALRTEAAALAKVAHPCLPVLFDTGERDRQLFYNAVSLDLGPTLTEFLQDKRLPFTQVVGLMETLARTVYYLHSMDLIHRHLRPDCVILIPAFKLPASSPAAKSPPSPAVHLLGDWYIPRLLGLGQAGRTREGDTFDMDLYGDQVGYLSPEQAWGVPKDLGDATDIYGLGGILYFLLMGRPPFQGDNPSAALDAIQTANVLMPSTYRIRTPHDLEQICGKCLARQPAKRYHSAGDLADDLLRARMNLPLVGVPTSRARKLGKWCRRHPTLVVTLLFLLFGWIGVMVAYSRGREDGGTSGRSYARLVYERDTARQETQMFRQQVSQLKAQQGLFAYREWLQRAAQAENKAERLNILERCPETERLAEWWLVGQKNIPPLSFEFDGRPPSLLALSSQGDLVVANLPSQDAQQHRLRLWSIRTPAQQGNLIETSWIEDISWHPDGSTLAVLGRNTRFGAARLSLFQRQGGELVRISNRDLFEERPSSLAYGPNRLVLGCGSGEMVWLGPLSGDQIGSSFGIRRFAGDQQTLRLAWRQDGNVIATWFDNGSMINLWDDRGSSLGSITEHRGIKTAAFSKSGYLAVAVERSKILSGYDPQLRAVDGMAVPLPDVPRQLAYSQDGRRLAVACAGKRLVIFGQSGPALLELHSEPVDGTAGLAFTPDGQSLIAAGANGVLILGKVPE